MAKDLLKFLFGESQVDDEIAAIVESIAGIDTDGEADGEADLKVEKKPLATALSALGIDTKGLENDTRGLSLVFNDAVQYRSAHAILNEPENLHKLAQLGWVFSTQGDVAMSREPAEFRLRFLEIDTVKPSKDEPKPTKGTAKNSKLSAVIKKGREFATTKPEHDDENPVDHSNPKKGTHNKGVGKEGHGANPDGSPKTGLSKAPSHSTPSASGLTQPKEGAHPTGKLKESDFNGQPQASPLRQPQASPLRRNISRFARHIGLSKQDDFNDVKCDKCGQPKKAGDVCDHSGRVESVIMHAPGCTCEDCKAKDGIAEGKHKPGCVCGFCKNKGNIATRFKKGGKTDSTDKPETEVEESSAAELVSKMLEGNPGTPPGITGHKSYPGMSVSSPDRKFRPAKGMVQAKPEGSVVASQTKPNRSA